MIFERVGGVHFLRPDDAFRRKRRCVISFFFRAVFRAQNIAFYLPPSRQIHITLWTT